jgi:hypothetical protein
MKKFTLPPFLIALIASLAACHNDVPPQQVQYQQPAPVVVQQAVPQQDNSGAALVAGAAIGAVGAAVLLSDRDRNVGPQYPQGYHQPAPQTNVTHVTKTTIINHAPVAAAAPAVAPMPAPVVPPTAPAPAGVNLAKTAPPVTTTPNFATAGTSSPVPAMSAAALTAPKTLSIPATSNGPAPNFTPSNVAQVGVNKPAAPVSLAKPAMLPAPTAPAKTTFALSAPAPRPATPLMLPPPKPAPRMLALPAPKPAVPRYNYNPAPRAPAVTYKPHRPSEKK